MTSRPARDRILARLHRAVEQPIAVPQAPVLEKPAWDREERIDRLTALMTAVRSEVHRLTEGKWLTALQELSREKGWNGLVYGPSSAMGQSIETAWKDGASGLPPLVAYSEPAETVKETLFGIDAGITTVRGAVADTGAVVLWPTEAEPRLISLVPPVHVALLRADTVYNSLSEMIVAENWPGKMPTNALLISGPSKTADIEFTLVFGVHGPKELILLIVD